MYGGEWIWENFHLQHIYKTTGLSANIPLPSSVKSEQVGKPEDISSIILNKKYIYIYLYCYSISLGAHRDLGTEVW